MSRPRYLTKSRFKLAYECPTKLFYEGRPEYKNKKHEDSFLEALANGGFQVGALAQVMHPGGIEITERAPDAAAAATQPYLGGDFLLFEAALRHGNYLIRADVLERRSDAVFLREVKAKSWGADEDFFKKRGRGLQSKWIPYLLDIAFQTHVARLVFPGLTIVPSLWLINKDAVCSVEGLHQRFRIDGRGQVTVAPGTTAETIGAPLLVEVPADQAVELLLNEGIDGMTVPEMAARYAEVLRSSERAQPFLKKSCKACEYRVAPADLAEGERSGFDECMRTALGDGYEARGPLLVELWKYSAQKSLDEQKHYLADLDLEEFGPLPERGPLDTKERQHLQIVSREPWLDHAGLAGELEKWIYPLHFIDFETCMVSIPFHRGHHPYQQQAFQFSHHVMERDGSVRHADEFLMPGRAQFPNYEFVRRLRAVLSRDTGTVFRYADHENSVLNQIKAQLLEDRPSDMQELVDFIESITNFDVEGKRQSGPRTMVDLKKLYQEFHYLPDTRGSNSLKYVLPAVLNASPFLREKYSHPLYGREIPSHNFKDHTWVTFDEQGKVRDPYTLLEPLLEGVPHLDEEDEAIKNGGTAMMAWAKLQFSETSAADEARIRGELLRYCELDTLAMVMLVEAWRDFIRSAPASRP